MVIEVHTKGIWHVRVILCRRNSNICRFTSIYGQNPPQYCNQPPVKINNLIKKLKKRKENQGRNQR